MTTARRTDYRASADDVLLLGLGEGDALALAEACTRTIAAGYAVTRRLVPGADVEAVLRGVYASLWTEPPDEGPLEGWVRRRCFEASLRLLRARGSAAAAPSTHLAAPDLPATRSRFVDATEEAMAALGDDERHALVYAHDAGVRAHRPGAPGAGAAATRALLALAEVDPAPTVGDPRAADWALGLLPASEAEAVATAVGGAEGDLARALRRGRRRLEGLPPGPDLAARLVAATLADAPPGAAPPEAAPQAPPAAAQPDLRHADGASTGDVTHPEDGPEPELDAEPEHGPPPEVVRHADGASIGDVTHPEAEWEPETAEEWDELPPEPEHEEPPPRRRRGVAWLAKWMLAIALAIGAGMLIGWVLLALGVLP